MIVGVDPGTTAGIAALDFRGNVIDLFSAKDLSRDKVIGRLVSLGRVSVIATDVFPVPSAVSKLAAQLGAVVDSPSQSLSVAEKLDITRPHDIENAHERDALAAALSTYSRLRNKFQKITSQGHGDEVIHLVVRGHPVEEALLRKLLDEKEAANRSLFDSLTAERRSRLRELEGRKEIRSRDRFIRSLEARIADMRRQIRDLERLRELLAKVSGGEIKVVGVFPNAVEGRTLIKRRLKNSDRPLLENVDVAFSPDSGNYGMLADAGVLAADADMLWEVGGCFFILSADLSRLSPKAVSLDRLVEEYRSRRF